MNFVNGIAWVFVIVVLGSLVSGRTLLKGQSGWVYRAEDPKTFWTAIACYSIAAAGFFFLAWTYHAKGIA
ncbi:MAG TPA: hypothetical protein VGN52_08675 [Burkholderiales bacterium]|jgi:hypothetical protein